MLWLALHFPRLGLEVWSLDRTAGTRPTVLVDRNQVVLCNALARTAGIQPGASLATAHSIATELAHFQRDEARELARLTFLGQTAYRFSAQVSLQPPDALVLEIGGSLALFGDPIGLARSAAALCERLGHETRRQLAATPGAALVMAASGARRLEDVPLADARLPEADRHVERLANMGLRTLGPLLELPERELARRFGPALVDHVARLAGRIPDPLPFIEPPVRFDQSLHLLEPVRDKAELLADAGPLPRLLVDLEAWLLSHQLGAEQLNWTFSSHTGRDPAVLPVPFARAQQSRQAFLSVVRLKLEAVSLPEDVLTIRLDVPRLTPWLGGSARLFGLLPEQMGSADVDTGELIDQLRARLGDGACSRIDVRDQHAPEAAWRSVPLSFRNRATAGRPPAAVRPLWLFDPPRPTDPDRLELIRGPERIQTAWWKQAVWRDYYVASLETGARCWAFVDGQNRWYLHGYFG